MSFRCQRVEQITLFLENRPGIFADLCAHLSDRHVNIRAITTIESTDTGIVRTVVDDPEAAKQILAAAEVPFATCDCLAVEMRRRVGPRSSPGPRLGTVMTMCVRPVFATCVGLAALAVAAAAVAGTGDPAAPVRPSTAGASAGSASVASALDPWTLWSQGTTLRGANIYQRLVYPELDGAEFMGSGTVGPPFVQEDFDSLAALGANLVNVSHPGLFTEDPPYVLDPEVEANLDALLAMIAQADLFAVIAFRTGPGRSEFTFHLEDVGDWFDASYLNNAVWTEQAAQDGWVAMWRHVAQRYADNPVVVGFDLMVEPNANEAVLDDVWDPEEFYGDHAGTLVDWNQLFPRITTAIRQVDAVTPILVGGMAYSAVEWLPWIEPSGDSRTVYVVHQYAPVDYTHQEPGGSRTYPGVFDTDWDDVDDQFNRAWIDDLLETVDDFVTDHSAPVAANEFGVMRWVPGAAAFMADQMDLLEERGMNHALWVWDPAWGPWTEEVTAFNFRHGPNPGNTTDVDSSSLIDAITAAWGRNTLRPSSFAGEAVFVPAAAHVGGVGGTEWRTDLEVMARGSIQASYSVALLRSGQDNSSPQSSMFTLQPGASARYEDVVDTVFGVEGTGALRLVVLAGTVTVSSRTYNDTPEGTYGQYIQGFEQAEAIATGEEAALIQLSRSASPSSGFRTNLGLLNATAASLTVEVRLFRAAGQLLGTRSYTLKPFEQLQDNDVFGHVTGGEVSDGYALVRTTTAGGAFFAYASVVDNQSGDPVYVPARR